MFGIFSPLVFPSCLCSRFVLCSHVVGGKMGMESKSCVAGTTGSISHSAVSTEILSPKLVLSGL